MPEDKPCKLVQPPKISEHRKTKKKKRKKAAHSTSASGNKEKPLAVSLPPDAIPVSLLPLTHPGTSRGPLPKLRATSKKNREQRSGNDQKSKKQHKDPQALALSHRSSGSESLARVTEPSVQARESLRWEGALQDPLEEAQRLEQYRANRRQRYIAHREALSKETKQTLR
ncbi:protein LIAT1 [Leuresthes tenuis]|uniref:protein LIAT1 n=1 Tax=Leuresthes tenuis TaxID=355514 RepID=UPI003B511D1C